ncbi:hypothetical protein EXIGLDRAFT_231120 [Exidia glandulosa HHB12029]|uniref:Fungal N-terminal domain-containing protein n=1 Tax=Exidia glandulosa HHB12029 TaxID=1314781 RepID=A0A165E5A5_EXIGL|nr:hypothetical protein EXIGLDRAFT_231120 [Exidia glandulosa HHB12029]
MVVAAFGFGSFGDIATVLQLAWTIRNALNEATGANAEIRTLLADIDSFTCALQEVQRSLVSRSEDELPEALRNGITHAVEVCRQTLVRIQAKIEAFKSKHRAGAWRKYAAVTSWTVLGGKVEVEGMKRRLAEQITVIETLLALSQSRDLGKIQATGNEAVHGINQVVDFLHDLPKRIGFGIPFHFIDSDGTPRQPLAALSPEEFFDAFGQWVNLCDAVTPRWHEGRNTMTSLSISLNMARLHPRTSTSNSFVSSAAYAF